MSNPAPKPKPPARTVLAKIFSPSPPAPKRKYRSLREAFAQVRGDAQHGTGFGYLTHADIRQGGTRNFWG